MGCAGPRAPAPAQRRRCRFRRPTPHFSAGSGGVSKPSSFSARRGPSPVIADCQLCVLAPSPLAFCFCARPGFPHRNLCIHGHRHTQQPTSVTGVSRGEGAAATDHRSGSKPTDGIRRRAQSDAERAAPAMPQHQQQPAPSPGPGGGGARKGRGAQPRGFNNQDEERGGPRKAAGQREAWENGNNNDGSTCVSLSLRGGGHQGMNLCRACMYTT